MNDEKVTIEIVNGCGGQSVYINDYRVAGIEPYGGGTVDKSWTVSVNKILEAIGIKHM